MIIKRLYTPKVNKVERLGYVRFRLRDRYFSVGHYENAPAYETGLSDMPEDALELGWFFKKLNPAQASGVATIIQYGSMGSGLDYAYACVTLMGIVNTEGGMGA